MSTVTAGVCVYCEGWGCTRCGKEPAPRQGEQGPAPEEIEHAVQLAAAVRAEREACAAVAEHRLHRSDCECVPCEVRREIAGVIRLRGGQ